MRAQTKQYLVAITMLKRIRAAIFSCSFMSKRLCFTEHFLLMTYLLSFYVTTIFLFSLPIKVTASIKHIHANTKARCIKLVVSLPPPYYLKVDHIINSSPRWSYIILLKFSPLFDILCASQEHCLVFREIPN